MRGIPQESNTRRRHDPECRQDRVRGIVAHQRPASISRLQTSRHPVTPLQGCSQFDRFAAEVTENMKVTVKLYGSSTGGLEKRELFLDLKENATAQDAVDHLPVEDRLYLYVVRNGMRLDQDARLRDGDELLVFPPITGGGGDLRWVGKSVTKQDALEKATGQAKFYSDLHLKDMLYGRILRANRPHALIKRIDISRAQALPGVVAVLTH